MSIIQQYSKELVALFVPLVAWIVNAALKARPRVVYSEPHAFSFLVQEPLRDADGNQVQPMQIVHTRSVLVRNEGRETAENVELVFNWKPQYLNTFPVRCVEARTIEDLRYSIRVGSLAPKEFFRCELMAVNRDVPALVSIRFDNGIPRAIVMEAQPVPPTWAKITAIILMTIGLGAAAYGVVFLIQFFAGTGR